MRRVLVDDNISLISTYNPRSAFNAYIPPRSI
jgi:hypothetical protein